MKQQDRYTRLAEVTRLINSRLELKDMLNHVVEAISEEVVLCDSVGIYLPQGNGTYKGFAGKPEFINGKTLDMHVIDPEADMLARQIIETKKTIYIPSITTDERPDAAAVDDFKIRSLLASPIVFDNEIYGLVFLFNYNMPMELTRKEIEAVEAYINMTAVAIRNANELKRKESLIAENQLILDVTKALSMNQTVEEAIETCFSYLEKVLCNKNAGMHFVEASMSRYVKPRSLNHKSEWSEKAWKETHQKVNLTHGEDPLYQYVMENRQSVYLQQAEEDPRTHKEAIKEFNIRSLLMIPLVSIGDVLGVVAVPQFHGGDPYFTETQQTKARSIVDAVAPVLSTLIYMDKQELIIQDRTSALLKKNEEQAENVKELERLSKEKAMILDAAGEGIFGIDTKGYVTFCNPAALHMLGYQEDTFVETRHIHDVFSTPIMESNPESSVFDEKPKLSAEFFKREDGTLFPGEYVLSPILDMNEIKGYVITLRDVTQRKEMEQKIRYHAYYDSLTGLANRVLFKDRVQQALGYAEDNKEQLAILFLDVDRFKNVNDSMGHEHGDLLLKQVAHRLREVMGTSDTLSRQGGDEFTVLLLGKNNIKEVQCKANSIVEAFQHPITINEIDHFITVSMGISLYPFDSDNVEGLLKHADTAMYRCKEAGGNQFQFYHPEMETEMMERMKLETALFKALEYEEMDLYYQPQFNMKTKELVGIEALIRWDHPSYGRLSPDSFISLAEETGLIIPIGEWVLRKACRQMKEWMASGMKPVTIAVNISPRHFSHSSFIENVQLILAEEEIDPGQVELELTENLLMHNNEKNAGKMEVLRSMGLDLAIDDFGTGYSSLRYLKDFPVSLLKIDRSFINSMNKDTKSAAITKSIISMAHNLELKVMAEGIETEKQVEVLLEQDCLYGQGYLFSKPMAAEDIFTTYGPVDIKRRSVE